MDIGIDQIKYQLETIKCRYYGKPIGNPINAPKNPVIGQLYFDSINNKIFVYTDGRGSWKEL
jgi:hypothetical protein